VRRISPPFATGPNALSLVQTARVWNKSPSELLALEAGSLEALVLDHALAQRLVSEALAAQVQPKVRSDEPEPVGAGFFRGQPDPWAKVPEGLRRGPR